MSIISGENINACAIDIEEYGLDEFITITKPCYDAFNEARNETLELIKRIDFLIENEPSDNLKELIEIKNAAKDFVGAVNEILKNGD